MTTQNPQSDPVLTLLQDIRDDVKEQGERLNALETKQIEPVVTDSTAQEINAISQFIHDNPIMAVFILLLLFVLAIIALFALVIPLAKRFMDNNFNHFGKDRSGNKITHAQIQRKQLEYQRKSYKILTKMAEKAGLRFRERDDELVL